MFGPRLAQALELDIGRLAAESEEVVLDPAHFVDAEGEPQALA
jgi:hypothetical protein